MYLHWRGNALTRNSEDRRILQDGTLEDGEFVGEALL